MLFRKQFASIGAEDWIAGAEHHLNTQVHCVLQPEGDMNVHAYHALVANRVTEIRKRGLHISCRLICLFDRMCFHFHVPTISSHSPHCSW